EDVRERVLREYRAGAAGRHSVARRKRLETREVGLLQVASRQADVAAAGGGVRELILGIDEEEDLVFHDRAAEREAVLRLVIVREVRLGARERLAAERVL